MNLVPESEEAMNPALSEVSANLPEASTGTQPSAMVIPFKAEDEWPFPAARYIRLERPEPPELPLDDILKPALSRWVREAAESKGAPIDYVFAGLLSAASSAIGNSYVASPWGGWVEPSILWLMAIGNPSAGKSPGLDAGINPLRKIETAQSRVSQADMNRWDEKAEIAKLAESVWRSQMKAALKEGESPPTKPAEMELPEKPNIPRFVVNDSTIERIAAILHEQKCGLLLNRDEIAGWLIGMERYAGGGTDRPFWLEAFGGRSFTVERMSREAITIERLAVSIVGGIQPDRLNTLLLAGDDDGLLARFIPIWPDPAPIKLPDAIADNDFIQGVLERLFGLLGYTDENDEMQPYINRFSDSAQSALVDFRICVRELEHEAEGLLLSFLGKLPSLAVRLSLVLQLLNWASDGGEVPLEISDCSLDLAVSLIWNYILPMAHRSYAEASISEEQSKAMRLVSHIRKRHLRTFTTREVLRVEIRGLDKADDLNPVLAILEDGDIIRPVESPVNVRGGRPIKKFAVNPRLWEQ